MPTNSSAENRALSRAESRRSICTQKVPLALGGADLARQTSKSEFTNEEPEALISSPWFRGFFFVAVALNALTMGLRLDVLPNNAIWNIFEHVFTAIFLMEMLIKLFCLKFAYFTCVWNLLDLVIVITAILDAWILGPVMGTEANFVRMFAFFRLLRVIKMLKMRRELMTLVKGIFGSLQSMLWIAVLLAGVVYVFAIFFTALIRDEIYTKGPSTDVPKKYFGSLSRTMLTLFNISILDEWNAIVRPVFLNQMWLVPFFLLFLILTAFSLMNAIVGIIVERTTDAAHEMDYIEAEDKRLGRMHKSDAIWGLVESLDKDKDQSISVYDIEEFCKDAKKMAELQGLLDDMDMPDFFTLEDLHTLLDLEASGIVTKQHFEVGFSRLAKHSPFHCMCLDQLTMGKIRRQLKHLGDRIDANRIQMTLILAELSAIRGHLKIPPPESLPKSVVPPHSEDHSAVTSFCGEVLQLPSLQLAEKKRRLSRKSDSSMRRSKSESRQSSASLQIEEGARKDAVGVLCNETSSPVCETYKNSQGQVQKHPPPDTLTATLLTKVKGDVALDEKETIVQLRGEIARLKAKLEKTEQQLVLASKSNGKSTKKSSVKGAPAQGRSPKAISDQMHPAKFVEQPSLHSPKNSAEARFCGQQRIFDNNSKLPALPFPEDFPKHPAAGEHINASKESLVSRE